MRKHPQQAMASPADLPTLLDALTDSLSSAHSSLPDTTALAPPVDGISLLDAKNELLLSYLQNLVFLIILKLRSRSSLGEDPASSESELNDAVTKKLVELRVYIEKGVRPLEGKLHYQLDKLLHAANEAGAASGPALPNGPRNPAKKNADVSASDPQEEEEEEGEDDDDDDDEDPTITTAPAIADLAHRPNPSAFARPPTTTTTTSSTSPATNDRSTGVYRPPRITPTALPTTDRAPQKAARQRTAHTMNEYIREEMDDAPMAEPSIGAGSGLRGKAREREEERRGYEEMRLVRLPEEKRKGGKRRAEVGDGKQDLDAGLGLGGMGGAELGGGSKRRKRAGEGPSGGRAIGEAWGRRVGRGVGGRKRR